MLSSVFAVEMQDIQKIRENSTLRFFARWDGGFDLRIKESAVSENDAMLDQIASKWGDGSNQKAKDSYSANLIFSESQIKEFLLKSLGEKAKELCLVEITDPRPSNSVLNEEALVKKVVSLLEDSNFKHFVIARHYGYGIEIIHDNRD
jgi:hypothetical protein